MDEKLKGFFDAAQKAADATTAAQTAAANAAAERARVLAEGRKQLRQQIDEELGPILDVLAALPEKDGKRFSTAIQRRGFDTDTDAEYSVLVSYRNPNEERYDHHYEYDRASPEIDMYITRKPNGSLDFRITQRSLMTYGSDGDPRHKSSGALTFEQARQELAVGLGTFSADRMAEIGAALGATQEASAATPATPADESKIDVFRKPIAFKNAARPTATPAAKEDTPPPVAKTVEAPAQNAVPVGASAPKKKKWFWQR